MWSHGQKLHLTAKEFRLRFPTEFTPSTPQSPFARVSCSPSALRACPPSLSVARDLPAARDGHRFESPQEVGAFWRDFLRRRIARHFRGLPRHRSVC
jgi:hypothetical protein